jgi:hypothetical protein
MKQIREPASGRFETKSTPMKILRNLALSAAVVAALSLATPAQAFWGWGRGPVFRGRVVVGYPGYYGYYAPAYYAPAYYPPAYYGYYGPYYAPYYGGGIAFGFGGHGGYGYRGGYRGGYGFRGATHGGRR